MPIKRIFSAGGIVLRRFAPQDKSAGSNGELKVLVTQHSGHKGWDFPKGHKEIYESEEQTAVREVEEEVGVRVEVIERVGQTQYFYYDAGEKVLKTVVYYLMKYKGEGEATTAEEVSGKVWLQVEEVEEKLTFKDTKELWKKARLKIERLMTND